MRISMPLRRSTLLVVVVAPLLCWAQSASLPLEQIISRMDQVRAAERANNPGYTVTREYQLAAADAHEPASDVLAQVSFFPPADKQYMIVKAEGNERGAGIVRKVLDHETSMANHTSPHEIDSANYDFALLGRETIEGHNCFVLQLSPRRQEVELLRGKAWVDSKSFDILRVEGETAKSPSIWLKKLTVTINFGHVNGVWLETFTQAVADVRFAGTHVLTSRELDVQTQRLSARARAPRLQPKPDSRIAADTAAWVAH